MDIDEDGCVDENEFVRVMCRFGFGLSTQQMRHVFRAIDEDGSGTIEFLELQNALKKQKEEARRTLHAAGRSYSKRSDIVDEEEEDVAEFSLHVAEFWKKFDILCNNIPPTFLGDDWSTSEDLCHAVNFLRMTLLGEEWTDERFRGELLGEANPWTTRENLERYVTLMTWNERQRCYSKHHPCDEIVAIERFKPQRYEMVRRNSPQTFGDTMVRRASSCASSHARALLMIPRHPDLDAQESSTNEDTASYYTHATSDATLEAHVRRRVYARIEEDKQFRKDNARVTGKGVFPRRGRTEMIEAGSSVGSSVATTPTTTTKTKDDALFPPLSSRLPPLPPCTSHPPPKAPTVHLTAKNAAEIESWLTDNDLESYRDTLVQQSGARSLNDVSDFLCSSRIVAKCFPTMTGGDVNRFVHAATKLRGKLRSKKKSSSSTVELAAQNVGRVGDFVFLPNTRHDIVVSEMMSLKFWPKNWVARIVDTHCDGQTNMCRLRLYVTTSDKMEAMESIGCVKFYRATSHIFVIGSRVVAGPITMRKVANIDAWELLDDLTLEEKHNLESWTPKKRAVSTPSFERCVTTMATSVDTVMKFRILARTSDEDSKRNKSPDENDALDSDLPVSLRMALDLNDNCRVEIDRVRRYKSSDKRWQHLLNSFALLETCRKEFDCGNEKCDIVDASLSAVVTASRVQSMNDSEDWTIETLTQVMNSKCRCKKGIDAFANIAQVRLFATAPVDVLALIPRKDCDDNPATSDPVMDLFPKGSFAYFPNPKFDPDDVTFARDGDDGGDATQPFLVGRVVSSEHGIYKMRIFDRQNVKSDGYIPRDRTPKFASALELSIKPILDMACDLKGVWHSRVACKYLTPLVQALPLSHTEADSAILAFAKGSPTARLSVGGAVKRGRSPAANAFRA